MLDAKQLLKQGGKYVIPARKYQWLRCCQRAKEDSEFLLVYNCVFEIMKLLAEGQLIYEDVMSRVNINYRLETIENYVVAFSPYGYNFVKQSPTYRSSIERMKHLDELNQKNLSYKKKGFFKNRG